MKTNVTKERLSRDEVAYGFQIRSSRAPEVVMAAAASGYHYVFIDLEHSTLDLNEAATLCTTALACGITPLVRVAGADAPEAPRILDGGAQGVIIPHVNTAQDALTAVRNCRFPPFGTRSSGGRALQLDWAELTSHETARLMNDQTLLVAMIESGEALENIEEIAAVEGIDVLSVGTNDLSLDLGVPTDFLHPVIEDAHKRVVEAARRNGKSVRLGGKYTVPDIRIGIERGSRLVTLGSDFNMLLASMRGMMAEVTNG